MGCGSIISSLASCPLSPVLGDLNLADDLRGGGVGAGDGVFFFTFSSFDFGVTGFSVVGPEDDGIAAS